MAKNLRWKVLTIVAVVALSIFAFYPPDQKVRLGLDLKGGVHLVLRVQYRRCAAAGSADDGRSARRAAENGEHPRDARPW